MKLKTDDFYNDISETVRAFQDVDSIDLTDADADMTVSYSASNGIFTAVAEYSGQTGTYSDALQNDNGVEDKRIMRRAAKLAVYNVMKKVTGIRLPWGSLTGIRPTKLLRDFSGDVDALNKIYDLPLEKGRLLERICENQAEFFIPDKNDIDIYIGIPFCRTRCSYCSFSSTDSTKGEKLMIPYVETLTREIKECAELVEKLNKRVRCVYIGGGTPTALTEELFDIMLECTSEHFKPSLEFTVEAGRPDTITEHKMRTMENCGVKRISINPQSMNAETLQKIGRSHSPEEIKTCFALARSIGFDTVNTDLIAGLPDETPEMFMHTLSDVLSLSPENVTVHTLALKRGSLMFEKGFKASNAADVQKMVETALDVLTAEGYEPYYLYRQKYMTGNFENIGYARRGHTGIYNIDIMEETTDILALGCGGVSKRIYRETDLIERAFNFKSIYQYNDGITEAMKRKYELFCDNSY